jgi:hypothetical protein
MYAFLAAITYKYNVLAITDRGDIWRIWFDGNQPLMQLVMNDDPEYWTAIRLLRAKKDLY